MRGAMKNLCSHFAGRRDEIAQLQAALEAHEWLIVILGVAGQGKSSLLTKWYQENQSTLDSRIGLFWCSPYQGGSDHAFSFDEFLDNLITYLTGKPFDRRDRPRTMDRVIYVHDLLLKKPTRIVLDGAERWLCRWHAAPDDDTKNLDPEDTKGAGEGVDALFQDLYAWADGSSLILTTRAIPRVLRRTHKVEIGSRSTGHVELLGLEPEKALEVLQGHEIRGEAAQLIEAARAYGFHAMSIDILGSVLAEQYDHDISRWEEADPSRGEVGELIGKALDRHPEDAALLEWVACSFGGLPREFAIQKFNKTQAELHEWLVRLNRWHLVEYGGGPGDITQHSVIRRCILERLGGKNASDVRNRRVELANWWFRQPLKGRDHRTGEPNDRPQTREEFRPWLRAIDHALEGGDADLADDVFRAKPGGGADCETLNRALDNFGCLEESLRVSAILIDLFEKKVGGDTAEGISLSRLHNNRGNALRDLGRLEEAFSDFDRASRIYEDLVEKEGRRELRNDLAITFNNRGTALQG
ncbi:hypothetical protein HQ520_08970, partial [bacterium]|nr:hypothetical protein [bacterium]